jgi:hypothetical protein
VSAGRSAPGGAEAGQGSQGPKDPTGPATSATPARASTVLPAGIPAGETLATADRPVSSQPAGSAAAGQRPSFEEFRQLAAHHTVVPVWRELLGDLETPVAAFRKLGGSEGSVLLESVERGERWGRYSFLGTDPFATFVARDGKVTWSGTLPDGLLDDPPGAAGRLPDGPPLAVLRAALARLRSPAIPGLPPLFAGAIGYLAWDVVRELERLPDTTEDDLGLPDAALVFPRSVVVFDHLAQRLVLVANALVSEGTDLAAAYADAEARLDRLTEGLAAPTAAQPTPLPVAGPPAAATSDLPPGRSRRRRSTSAPATCSRSCPRSASRSRPAPTRSTSTGSSGS